MVEELQLANYSLIESEKYSFTTANHNKRHENLNSCEEKVKSYYMNE